MPIDRKAVQDRLKNFDFSGLFTQELGWDWHTANLSIIVGGTQYDLEAVAHKRGMVAYHCPAPGGARIPEYALRRKIEHQVTKTAREHLIIFTDVARTTQIWQWVKREPGKPAACRERTYHKGQSGEILIQRLQEIAFTLEEEEKLTLPDVASRTRKGFDLERVTRKFYDQFQKEHASFLKFIEGITEIQSWKASGKSRKTNLRDSVAGRPRRPQGRRPPLPHPLHLDPVSASQPIDPAGYEVCLELSFIFRRPWVVQRSLRRMVFDV